MSGEVVTFTEMFEIAISIPVEFSQILKRTFLTQLFTDGQSIFDIMSKGSRTSEKRTMLNIAVAPERFSDRLISNFRFGRSNARMANELTKPMSQVCLQNMYKFFYRSANGALDFKKSGNILTAVDFIRPFSVP